MEAVRTIRKEDIKSAVLFVMDFDVDMCRFTLASGDDLAGVDLMDEDRRRGVKPAKDVETLAPAYIFGYVLNPVTRAGQTALLMQLEALKALLKIRRPNCEVLWLKEAVFLLQRDFGSDDEVTNFARELPAVHPPTAKSSAVAKEYLWAGTDVTSEDLDMFLELVDNLEEGTSKEEALDLWIDALLHATASPYGSLAEYRGARSETDNQGHVTSKGWNER